MKPSLAIIGTGIAGMGAAYFLKDEYDIYLYEKNNYPGGHTNTLTINEEGNPIYIDSAFMVYNEITYPNLTQFFADLGVETKSTDMSFSVQFKPTGLEYCGTGFKGLFAQRRNIFSVRFWKMLLDMDRFNKESPQILDKPEYLSMTTAEYAKKEKLGHDFLIKFLLPMSSAVWSTPPGLMMDFPIVTLVRFFKNHGFLGLDGHYQWRTVVEGSQRYRDKILRYFKDKVSIDNPVSQVIRQKGKVLVIDSKGNKRVFDKVIIAAHADEALKILDLPTADEQRLLSKFTYQKNSAILHTDVAVMPKTKGAWSSWNYSIKEDSKRALMPSTIYWMNNLQGVSKRKDYFVSINDPGDIAPNQILWQDVYDHPIFNVEAIKAQAELQKLNASGPIYFCGSYFRYGFHEDAFTSSIEAVKAINGAYPQRYRGFER